MTSSKGGANSLDRRLRSAGDRRSAVDRLAGRVPLPGPLRPGLLSVPRVLERAGVIGYDLWESIRTGRPVPWFGEPRRAIQDAEGPVPQHPRYLTYWDDPENRTVMGVHLGLDIVHRDGQFHILEVNMDAALRPPRRALYEEPVDPLFRAIAGAARQGGFGKVVLHRYAWPAPWRAEIARAGEEAGIEALAASFPSAYHKPPHPLGGLPSPPPRETMFVFFSSRNTPVDYYVHDKECTERWLARGLAGRRKGDPPLHGVPSFAAPDFPLPDNGPRWPNLVVKLADYDGGKYVRLARVRDEEEARRAFRIDAPGTVPKVIALSPLPRLVNRLTSRGKVIFQPFIPYSLDERERPVTYRLHILVTPRATAFLSAHTLVGPERIPEELPFGLVPDHRVYVLSFSKGASYGRVPGRIEEELRAIAPRIGAVVQKALDARFVTGRAGGTRGG
ncbi:MAG: hypothetical protein ABIK65_08870 [Candidatus Eisenbacteria bacterium]